MQNSIFFTVIIPIYNTMLHIQACVDSVLSQNYHNYEVILVNDGSNDNSEELCQKYSEKYKNVKYIHKENGGPASARNVGLFSAEGEYIIFLDSDDRLHEELLYTLNDIIGEKKYDIYFGTYSSCDKEKRNSKAEPFSFDMKIIDEGNHIKVLENLFMQNSNFFSSWRHTYKREMLIEKSVVFDENLFVGEDGDFVIKAILSAKTYGVAAIPFCYVTVGREGSIMTNINPKAAQSQFDFSIRWFNFFQQEYELSNEGHTVNLAHRFANAFCEGIANSGSLTSKERSGFKELVKDNEHILKYTYGRKYEAVKRIYRLFDYNMSSYVIFKLYKLNLFMHNKFSFIWKSTYDVKKRYINQNPTMLP